MATIILNQLHCIRKQDVSGDDEPVLYIAGQQVWEGKMSKGELSPVNKSRTFDNSVVVELKEKNGSSSKSLGKWTIPDTPVAPDKLTATSSGYHYELYYDVD